MKLSNHEILEKLGNLLTSKIEGFDLEQSIASQLDSIQIFALVPFVEDEFGIRFDSTQLTRENLESLETWARVVERLLSNHLP